MIGYPFHRLDQVELVKEEREWQPVMGGELRLWKIKSCKGIHMLEKRESMSFYLTGMVYLLFNLRPAADLSLTIKATLMQLLETVPYVAGITFVLVALLQYMSDGEKVPWERRLRLFFTIGIFAGLVYAIVEYTRHTPAL